MARGNDAVQYGLAGAGSGAAIGSIVPGVGTGIGALAGGGLGALYGLFGGGSSDEGADLQRTYQEIANRYEQYRPEDMARRRAALQQAMQLFQPSRDMASAMAGGAPMPDWQSFFQPSAPPPAGPVMTGRGTFRGPPRGAGPGLAHVGVPSGDAGVGPPPGPQDPWRGMGV